MYDDNVLLLVTALAEDAANEYREYKELAKNSSFRRERDYLRLRAEESLKFFESDIFNLAFPNKKEYILEQLRKE